MFTWQEGRQGTGYRKLLLCEGKSFDVYLIDYPPGSYIPEHTDPVPGKKHYRINFLIFGKDNYSGKSLFKTRRINYFRPDIMPHSVSLLDKRRLIFSIGWVV